jgi:hypothetical protein
MDEGKPYKTDVLVRLGLVLLFHRIYKGAPRQPEDYYTDECSDQQMTRADARHACTNVTHCITDSSASKSRVI